MRRKLSGRFEPGRTGDLSARPSVDAWKGIMPRSGWVPRATDPTMVDSYFKPIGSPIPTRVAPRWGCLLERSRHLPGTLLSTPIQGFVLSASDCR